MDELFDVRNNFYLGHYQPCINAAQKMNPSSPDVKSERDIYMYRAYIAQGKYNTVLNEITDNAKAELKAVKLYAQYMQNPANRSRVIESLDVLLADPITGSSPTVQLMGGTVCYLEGDYDKAMRTVASASTLECVALIVQACLKVDRVDVAQKELKRMSQIDDDATLTQLATAWVDLALGGDKYQDAYYIYQDLKVKYSPSAMLLNGEAACLIHQGKHSDAESLLQEALSSDPNDVQTLINLVVISQQLAKPPEVSRRYLSQLQDMAPTHPFVKQYASYEDVFGRSAAKYSLGA